MKNTLLFIYSTNILGSKMLTVNMKNCLTPKHPKMCDPILVTLLKMRPHYSQSSCENATPSSSTSPWATYKEVPTLPPLENCVFNVCKKWMTDNNKNMLLNDMTSFFYNGGLSVRFEVSSEEFKDFPWKFLIVQFLRTVSRPVKLLK